MMKIDVTFACRAIILPTNGNGNGIFNMEYEI